MKEKQAKEVPIIKISRGALRRVPLSVPVLSAPRSVLAQDYHPPTDSICPFLIDPEPVEGWWS